MKGIGTSQHKAVAPIIATLLMVAIAVVGGILIFVFTQGFFADEQVVGPTVDNIRIIGYDAADQEATVKAFLTASGTESCGAALKDGNLSENDCINIWIENLGDKPVAIQAVRIFGVTYTDAPDGITGACPGPQAAGSAVFDMYSSDASFTLISILEPNEIGQLCISYMEGTAGTVDPGRKIPIQVETSNGQSSQINIINGATRGQQ